jgi:hypothetical protein
MSGYVSVADREKNAGKANASANSKGDGLQATSANSRPSGAGALNSAKAAIAGLTSSQFFGGLLPFLFWAAVAAFVIFLILLLIHYTVYPVFSFNPGDGGLIPIPAASDEYIFSKGEIVASDRKILLKEPLGDEHFPKKCGFTVAMDVYDQGVVQSEQPRILLYRSGEAAQAPNTGFKFTSSTDTATKQTLLGTQFPNSDLVLFLDPGLNNLSVAVKIQATPAAFQILGPIENTPVRVPYRLTVTYMKELVELYVNGKLKKSFPIRPPVEPADTNTRFWSRFDGQTTALIAHVSYWDRILSAREIEAHGGAKTSSITFSP